MNATPFKDMPRAKGPFFPDGAKYLVCFVDGSRETVMTRYPWPAPFADGMMTLVDRYVVVYEEGKIKPVHEKYIGAMMINMANVAFIAECPEETDGPAAG